VTDVTFEAKFLDESSKAGGSFKMRPVSRVVPGFSGDGDVAESISREGHVEVAIQRRQDRIPRLGRRQAAELLCEPCEVPFVELSCVPTFQTAVLMLISQASHPSDRAVRGPA
jgi:hypothetical protein